MADRELSNAEKLAATLLYYFSAGMDAQRVVSEGGGKLHLPGPSDADLERVRHTASVPMWENALEIGKYYVLHIVETEPRTAVQNLREGLDAVQDLGGRLSGALGKLRELAPKKGESQGGSRSGSGGGSGRARGAE